MSEQQQQQQNEPQFRFQMLIEEYEIARQLASLGAVETAVERAHMDGRLNDTEYERRRREIFAHQVKLQHREKDLRKLIDKTQPRLGPENANSMTIEEEKEFLAAELAYLSRPIGSRPMIDQLLRESSMAARLADILLKQKRDAKSGISRSRKIEEDPKATTTRRDSARARRQQLEKIVAEELPVEEERLHQQRQRLQQLIRERTTRQGVYMPLQHHAYDLNETLERRAAAMPVDTLESVDVSEE